MGKTVLAVGNYDLQTYDRARIMIKGLRRHGTSVEESIRRSYLRHAASMLRSGADVVLVTGKPCLFLAWLLRPLHRKKIVFDAFISDYDTLVNDRKRLAPGSFAAKMVWWGDKLACKAADRVVLDTQEHVDYFVAEFGLDKESFRVVPVGADDEVFIRRKREDAGRFIVCFHGTYIPLQGVGHIVDAAAALNKRKDISFVLIGDGQTRRSIEERVKGVGLENIEFLPFMPLDELADAVARSTVALGIFGTTDKARRVVPNKAFQIIAMGLPLITGDTPAIRRYFTDGDNALLVPLGDGKSIARAILSLKRDKRIRDRIAQNGHSLFLRLFSIDRIGSAIKDVIDGR